MANTWRRNEGGGGRRGANEKTARNLGDLAIGASVHFSSVQLSAPQRLGGGGGSLRSRLGGSKESAGSATPLAGPSLRGGCEPGQAAGPRRGGACGAVRGPEESLCGPRLPSRRPPATAPFALRSAASLRRIAAVLPATPGVPKLNSVDEELPQMPRFGVRAWDPDTRGLHLRFHKPFGTAGGHLKLKANNKARSCEGGDSNWATSPAWTLRGFGRKTEFPRQGYEAYVEESFSLLTVEDYLKWPWKSMGGKGVWDVGRNLSGGRLLPPVGRRRPASLCAPRAADSDPSCQKPLRWRGWWGRPGQSQVPQGQAEPPGASF